MPASFNKGGKPRATARRKIQRRHQKNQKDQLKEARERNLMMIEPAKPEATTMLQRRSMRLKKTNPHANVRLSSTLKRKIKRLNRRKTAGKALSPDEMLVEKAKPVAAPKGPSVGDGTGTVLGAPRTK